MRTFHNTPPHWRQAGHGFTHYTSVTAVLDHNGYPAAPIGLTLRGATVDPRQLRHLGQTTVNAATALSQRISGKI